MASSTPFWQLGLYGLAWTLTLLLGLLAAGWGTLALHYQAPPWPAQANVYAGVWALLWLLLLGLGLSQRRLLPIWAIGLVLIALLMSAWWLRILPQADRSWADEVARLPRLLHLPAADGSATDRVQIEQVRNFAWHSDTDYQPRWETRSYDLSQLRSLDVGLSYWMGPAIAHTLVSFGFADGQQLVFSVEIRKERGERFDALAGFFKQYEMALVAADERDILAVRTNVRGEQVHLYRVHLPPADMRALFLAYAEQAAQLQQSPRFYHTLTANCTTIVWQLARRIGQTLPLDWRLLASGYLPEYLRDSGALSADQPLDMLRQAGDITALAQQWQPPAGLEDSAQSADFSRFIRQNLPASAP